MALLVLVKIFILISNTMISVSIYMFCDVIKCNLNITNITIIISNTYCLAGYVAKI